MGPAQQGTCGVPITRVRLVSSCDFPADIHYLYCTMARMLWSRMTGGNTGACRMQGEGSGRAAEALRWEGGGSRSARARRPDRMQWPHSHHPLMQPRPPPQLAGGRITPPSLWEPAGPAKRDSARQQVHPQGSRVQCCTLSVSTLASVDESWSFSFICIQATRAVSGSLHCTAAVRVLSELISQFSHVITCLS